MSRHKPVPSGLSTVTDPPQGFFNRLGVVRFRIIVIVCVVAMLALIVYAASKPSNGRPNPPVVSTSSVPPTANPSLGTGQLDPPDQPELAQTIAYLENKYQVSLGVALAPISVPGRSIMRPWQAGSLSTGLAWQTLDTAIAVAVLREPKQPEDSEYLLRRALHESSPAGSTALWQFLGVDTDAAAKTLAVLAANGDSSTQIPINTADPGIPPYPQTRWGLANQAAFVGAMYCTTEGQLVLKQLTSLQRDFTYGLALLPGAAVRSGFGVELGGATSVRQAAIVSLPNGVPYAVSVQVVAVDATLDTAKATLNELAPAILAFSHGITGYC
ncbi:MAG: hypothetical protein LBJ43_01820 [Propionibacteriaceae bacterium]|jgi:hypothetical protein|nr:hypothetical protein [Propionibacteriaceae bacterium]